MNTTIIQEPTVEEAMDNVLVTVDNNGTARITGTRIKVTQIALEHTRRAWTSEQIVRSHPHLTLAQVGAALDYYDHHREAVEAQINAALAYADKARQEAEPSSLAEKLRAERRQTETPAA